MTLSRDNRSFTLDALVVEDLDVDVLARAPFHDLNDITVCIPKRHALYTPTVLVGVHLVLMQ